MTVVIDNLAGREAGVVGMERVEGKRVLGLDGLRGVAILLVLLIHVSLVGGAFSGLERGLQSVCRMGWVGVDLFFVLSGYLITGILFDAKGKGNFFRNFYMRRVLRIFPLYYSALLVMLVIIPWFTAYPSADDNFMVKKQAWFWLYGTNFCIMRYPQLNSCSLLQLWSLAIEEHFYMVWPVVVFFLARRPLAWVCVGIVALTPVLRLGYMHFFPDTPFMGRYLLVITPFRIDTLALGGLLALWARGPGGLGAWMPMIRWVGGISAGLLGFFVIYWGSLPRSEWVFAFIGYTLLALFLGGVMAEVLTERRGGILRRVCENGVLRFFGKYSYGIYVVHFPILLLVIVRLGWHEWLMGHVRWGWMGTGMYYGVGILLPLGGAVVSFYLVERPFLLLKRFFI